MTCWWNTQYWMSSVRGLWQKDGRWRRGEDTILQQCGRLHGKGLKAQMRPTAQPDIYTAVPLCLLERVHCVTSHVCWRNVQYDSPLYERKKESQSHIVCSAVKSVAIEWDPTRESHILVWLAHRLHQSRQKALCLLVSMSVQTLRPILLSAEYAIWFHSLATAFGFVFLECHFGHSVGVFLSLTQDSGRKMSYYA